MPVAHIDIESFSETDLRTAGAYKYARKAQIIIAAWAIDDGPIKTWEYWRQEPPDELIAILRDPNMTKVAHNAQFERALFEACWKVPCPPENWRCNMAQGLSLSLPGALDQLCKVLGVPEEKSKMAEGKRLMRLFCIPGTPTENNPSGRFHAVDYPEKWATFVEYCVRDVEAERACHDKMRKWKLPPQEHRLWCLDQRINAYGLPVDMNLVESVLYLRDLDEQTDKEKAIELTELDNPNSRNQLLEWLQERGVVCDNLKAVTVDRLLAHDDIPDDVRAVLEIRRSSAKSSIKKFSAFLKATDVDHRVRGCFQYAGAGRTWRWAGRLIQPHNFARGDLVAHVKHADKHEEERLKEQVMETAREVILARDTDYMKMMYDEPSRVFKGVCRMAIRAPQGREFAAADYVSIESVMLAWAAGCDYLLNMFRQGRDAYKDFASHWLGKPYDQVTKAERNLSKPPALGCGYLLGWKGLIAYGTQFGVNLTEAQARSAVDTYRSVYAEIPAFWYELDDCVRYTIQTRRPSQCRHFKIYFDNPFLMIELPSGRCLAYLRPIVMDQMKPWGEVGPTITYYGREQGGKNFKRISTHPGKITENCLSGSTQVLTERGWKSLSSITDEKVWDGGSWVEHDGLSCRGVQSVLEFSGLVGTSDHRILLSDGWATLGDALEANRLDWENVRLPENPELRWIEGRHPVVESSLPLRHGESDSRRRVDSQNTSAVPAVLRLHEKLDDRCGQYLARNVEASSLRRVVEHDRPMPSKVAQGLSSLWRAGNQSLRQMAEFVSRILDRHGSDIPKRPNLGTVEQRQGVLAGKLLLDDTQGASIEHTSQREDCAALWRTRDAGDSCGSGRDKSIHGVLPSRALRNESNRPPEKAGRQEQVFDLINCGPNHRFTVMTGRGPLLVHNCIQAIARDVLAYGIEQLDANNKPDESVIGHFHDEGLSELPLGRGAEYLEKMKRVMVPPAWCADAPIRVEGWHGLFYRKD